MISIDVRNVNDGYNRLMRWMTSKAKLGESRNGKVMSLECPTMVKFRMPAERVLYDRDRRANPFFHLFEALWMLAGSDKVAPVRFYNSQMYTYSDDGERFNAAYGFRWRQHFGYDQIQRCVDMIKANPQDRRVVITQWDPLIDLGSASLDIPCNQQIFPRVYDGKLNFLTTNRSNDLVWGLCGANAVHLTMLMEYMAILVGLPLGEWVHVSNNLHVYEHHFDLMRDMQPNPHLSWMPYPKRQPMLTGPEEQMAFDRDCLQLVAGEVDDFESEFFDMTVAPMIQAWHKHKAGDAGGAMYDAQCVESDEWRLAAIQWLKGAKK